MIQKSKKFCECGHKIVVSSNKRRANKGFKFRKNHDLCPRCYRSIMDRNEAVLELR